jgi:hypothetical protein
VLRGKGNRAEERRGTRRLEKGMFAACLKARERSWRLRSGMVTTVIRFLRDSGQYDLWAGSRGLNCGQLNRDRMGLRREIIAWMTDIPP